MQLIYIWFCVKTFIWSWLLLTIIGTAGIVFVPYSSVRLCQILYDIKFQVLCLNAQIDTNVLGWCKCKTGITVATIRYSALRVFNVALISCRHIGFWSCETL